MGIPPPAGASRRRRRHEWESRHEAKQIYQQK
jgi:hypothetical protein